MAVAIAAPYLAPAFLVTAFGTATATAITAAVLSTVVAVGLSIATRALTKGKAAPSAEGEVGPPQIFRQTITNSFIVYGRRRVGGLIVFIHGKQSGNDHFRYFVIAVAGHRCLGIVQWMLNDEVVTVDGSGMVTSGKYANAAWLWFQRGEASETANSVFVAECDGKWTSAHKGNGTAAFYAKFKLTDAIIQAGMPNITAVIDGHDNIGDPRVGDGQYRNNAALVFYHWMKTPREEGGFGAYLDEIPDDSWIAAQANVCDEVVDGEPRYTINGVITTGASPAEVRDAMVVNMAGTYTYSGGKHLMRPGYWVPVSVTLSEDDLAGPVQVSPFFPADQSANEVQGTYINPNDGYQAAPLPTQQLSPAPADVRQMDVDLAFTTSPKQGARVLSIMLQRAQREKTVVWPMNIAGLAVKAMDTVQLASSRYGLDNYAWSVGNWGLSGDYGVVLSLREESADIYDPPTVTTPSAPPSITPPTPIVTSAELTALIDASKITGLTFSINDAGDCAISDHTRVYADKSVGVTGAGAETTGATAGQFVYIYYDDPDRAGGAVDYQSLVLPSTGGDASSAFASPSHPARHFVASGVVPAAGGTTTGGSDVGSGGGSDGYCETEDAPIWMANETLDGPGIEKTLADVAEGDWVWTQHELRPEWGAYRIVRRQLAADQDVFKATIDGRVRRATANHLYRIDGWQRMEDLGVPDGKATVVKITVDDAHTYYGGGLLSHNIKAGA